MSRMRAHDQGRGAQPQRQPQGDDGMDDYEEDAPASSAPPAASSAASSAPHPTRFSKHRDDDDDAAPARPSKRQSDHEPEDSHEAEMRKLKIVTTRVREIKLLLEALPILTPDTVPCVSAHIAKDQVPVNCTTKGLAEKKRGLTLKVGVANAEVDRLETALHNYTVKFNEACEAQYSLRAYRAELRAVEATRNDVIAERKEIAAQTHLDKIERVKGYEERFERKESNKRKKLGTDDTKKKSVFDI
jgi:hypothetical protein